MTEQLFDPIYISTKELKKYFKNKKLTITTPEKEKITIKEVLIQYERETTLKQIRKIIINNIKKEIELYNNTGEMTDNALAEHITDKLLDNLQYFEIYIKEKEDTDCRII